MGRKVQVGSDPQGVPIYESVATPTARPVRINPFSAPPVADYSSGPLGVASLPTQVQSMPLTPGLVKGAPGSGWSYQKGPGYFSAGYGPSSGSLYRDPTNRFADPRLNNASSLAYLNPANWDFVETIGGQGGGMMVPNKERINKEAQERVAMSGGEGGGARPGLTPVPGKYQNAAIGDTMGGAFQGLTTIRNIEQARIKAEEDRELERQKALMQEKLEYAKLAQSAENERLKTLAYLSAHEGTSETARSRYALSLKSAADRQAAADAKAAALAERTAAFDREFAELDKAEDSMMKNYAPLKAAADLAARNIFASTRQPDGETIQNRDAQLLVDNTGMPYLKASPAYPLDAETVEKFNNALYSNDAIKNWRAWMAQAEQLKNRRRSTEIRLRASTGYGVPTSAYDVWGGTPGEDYYGTAPATPGYP